jgi:hypothetical protein
MLIDELSSEKREDIKLLCQKLFNENYIPEYIFAANEKLRKANPDYSMLLACFDAVSEILDSCGSNRKIAWKPLQLDGYKEHSFQDVSKLNEAVNQLASSQ